MFVKVQPFFFSLLKRFLKCNLVLLSSTNLITELHILACCLSLVITKAPAELRKVESHSVEEMLQIICEENKLLFKEAQEAYERLFLTLLNIVNLKVFLFIFIY